MKIKFVKLITAIITLVLLVGCHLPVNTTPTPDLVATQVALLLSESPTATELPPINATEPMPTETVTAVEPSATATETPTPTPTHTQTPTATEDLNDPAQKLGEPQWTQDFSGSESPWDFDSPQATFEVINGALTLTAKTNPNWHSWYVSSPRLKNAYVEATIEMSNCSGNDRFGLAVRSSSDGQQFYFLGITCDGQWGFFRMAEDVDINQIQPFQTAAPLSSGTNLPHRVGIWMEGASFTIYIDGEEVGSANDATLSNEGYTGFLIAYSNTPGYMVRVDQLRYWNVP